MQPRPPSAPGVYAVIEPAGVDCWTVDVRCDQPGGGYATYASYWAEGMDPTTAAFLVLQQGGWRKRLTAEWCYDETLDRFTTDVEAIG